jgi:head-tail adaptor
MQSGQLDRLVTFRTRTPGEDSLGQPNGAWVDVDTVWASVSGLRGREWLAAGQMNVEVTYRIRTRYHGGLATLLASRATLRAVTGSLVYEVVHGIASERGSSSIEFMCKQVEVAT